jgi:hypothetical protein
MFLGMLIERFTFYHCATRKTHLNICKIDEMENRIFGDFIKCLSVDC